jgi:hypothetical protein
MAFARNSVKGIAFSKADRVFLLLLIGQADRYGNGQMGY